MSSGQYKMIRMLQWFCLLLALGYAFVGFDNKVILSISVVFMFLFLLNWALASSLKSISDKVDKMSGGGGA